MCRLASVGCCRYLETVDHLGFANSQLDRRQREQGDGQKVQATPTHIRLQQKETNVNQVQMFPSLRWREENRFPKDAGYPGVIRLNPILAEPLFKPNVLGNLCKCF